MIIIVSFFTYLLFLNDHKLKQQVLDLKSNCIMCYQIQMHLYVLISWCAVDNPIDAFDCFDILQDDHNATQDNQYYTEMFEKYDQSGNPCQCTITILVVYNAYVILLLMFVLFDFIISML